jgi:hypothetical protein
MVCGYATVVPDANSSGHGIYGDPYDAWEAWRTRERYRRLSTVMVGRALTFMAGIAAETAILGKCEGGGDDDRYQIACMLDEVYGEDRLHHEARLWVRAHGLVRRHRQKIERVATALMARRTLTAEDIDAIMGCASTERPRGWVARSVAGSRPKFPPSKGGFSR